MRTNSFIKQLIFVVCVSACLKIPDGNHFLKKFFPFYLSFILSILVPNYRLNLKGKKKNRKKFRMVLSFFRFSRPMYKLWSCIKVVFITMKLMLNFMVEKNVYLILCVKTFPSQPPLLILYSYLFILLHFLL